MHLGNLERGRTLRFHPGEHKDDKEGLHALCSIWKVLKDLQYITYSIDLKNHHNQ